MVDRELGYECGCIYIIKPKFDNQLPTLEPDNKLVVSFEIEVSSFCNKHLEEASA